MKALKKTAKQLQAEIDQVLGKFPREPWEKKIDVRRGKGLTMWIAALKKSPALIVTEQSGGKSLILRTGEMQNREEGKLRATMFGIDGPHGHITRDTDRELAEELRQHYAAKSIRPATESEIMQWTATPEFARGSKLSAFTQASNMIRYRGSQVGKYERASEIDRKASDLVATDIDRAIAMLQAGIKEMR